MIKNIIFDWGGVLIIGESTLGILRGLKERFGANIPKKLFETYLDIIDSNSMPFEKFVEKVNKDFEINVTLEEMTDIFEKSININEDVRDLIKKLSKDYTAIILSNNNWPCVNYMRNQHADLLDLFKRVYFSCEFGIIKPGKAFFEFMLKDSNLTAEECVFVDDNEKNIITAKKLGFKTILFKDAVQLEQELKTFINS